MLNKETGTGFLKTKIELHTNKTSTTTKHEQSVDGANSHIFLGFLPMEIKTRVCYFR